MLGVVDQGQFPSGNSPTSAALQPSDADGERFSTLLSVFAVLLWERKFALEFTFWWTHPSNAMCRHRNDLVTKLGEQDAIFPLHPFHGTRLRKQISHRSRGCDRSLCTSCVVSMLAESRVNKMAR